MEDGEGPVGVVIAEIDDVRASSEGAERRSAGFDLGRRGIHGKKEKGESEKQIPRGARNDKPGLIGDSHFADDFHRAPTWAAVRPELRVADRN